MADKNDSTSWWQWIGDTASSLYTAKLNSDATVSNNKALIEAQKSNETLSFFGYELHKNTLVWVAGGVILTTFLLVLLKRK